MYNSVNVMGIGMANDTHDGGITSLLSFSLSLSLSHLLKYASSSSSSFLYIFRSFSLLSSVLQSLFFFFLKEKRILVPVRWISKYEFTV